MGVILSMVSEPIASVIINIYNWVCIVFQIVMVIILILMIVGEIYDDPTRAKKIAKEVTLDAIALLVFIIPIAIDIISYVIDNRKDVLYELIITVVSIIMIPVDIIVDIYALAFDRDE